VTELSEFAPPAPPEEEAPQAAPVNPNPHQHYVEPDPGSSHEGDPTPEQGSAFPTQSMRQERPTLPLVDPVAGEDATAAYEAILAIMQKGGDPGNVLNRIADHILKALGQR
jgi:hypothetical protein